MNSAICHTRPRQALRGSLLKKYAVVRAELNRMHNERLSKYEKIECLENIRAFVQVRHQGGGGQAVIL